MKKYVLVALVFLITLLTVPIQITHAAAPFGMSWPYTWEWGDKTTNLKLDQTVMVGHSITALEINCNQMCVMGQVKLQDAEGNDVPLIIPEYDPFIAQAGGWRVGINQSALPLKANEAYTLTLIGGPNSWNDAQGNYLPADIVYHFQTDDAPIIQQYNYNMTFPDPFGVDIFHWYDVQRLPHSDVFHMTTKAGAHLVNMGGVSDENCQFLVTLQDSRTQQVVSQQVLRFPAFNETLNVPNDGEYDLIVTPNFNYEYTLFVQGPDLQMSKSLAGVTFKNFDRYETLNTPFDLNIYTTSNVQKIDLLLDGQFLRTVTPDYAGNVAPTDAKVDPSGLADGVHHLTYAVYADGGQNSNVFTRDFLVDRVASFADVPLMHWAHHAVDAMHDLGIVDGNPTGQYMPDANVARGEFAKLMALSLHLPIQPNSTDAFVDVPTGVWYKPYVDALKNAGVMQGTQVGGKWYFNPTQPIMRAEVASAVLRATPNKSNAETPVQLKDFQQVPPWAQSAVATIYTMGWMKGYQDGTFGARNNMTRAEAAQVLSHVLGIKEEK